MHPLEFHNGTDVERTAPVQAAALWRLSRLRHPPACHKTQRAIIIILLLLFFFIIFIINNNDNNNYNNNNNNNTKSQAWIISKVLNGCFGELSQWASCWKKWQLSLFEDLWTDAGIGMSSLCRPVWRWWYVCRSLASAQWPCCSMILLSQLRLDSKHACPVALHTCPACVASPCWQLLQECSLCRWCQTLQTCQVLWHPMPVVYFFPRAGGWWQWHWDVCYFPALGWLAPSLLGFWACLMALHVMSFMWLWCCCLGPFLRQDNLFSPHASTALPYTQVCGSQASCAMGLGLKFDVKVKITTALRCLDTKCIKCEIFIGIWYEIPPL